LFGLQESPTAFGSSYSEEVNRPLTVVAERLDDRLNHVFGAFDAEAQLVGVVTLRREGHLKGAHKAYIYAMYVTPEFRQLGVGRALLDAALARAAELGLRQVSLLVVTANRAAVRLYESAGFETFGLERDAFYVGEAYYDVAYMALKLPELE
jgi:ribosomal protein S18 acetylase RimI-like enzyme